MEIDYLQEFLVLTETMNYLEAAERLFLSQPTLTRHIQLLEKKLGATLFRRTSRKMELSAFGKRFLPYARSLVELQARCMAELCQNKKIIIGFGSALAPHNLSVFFTRFKTENPDIQLEIVHPTGQFEMLRTYRCDFLMADENLIPAAEFDSTAFLRDRLVAVVPAAHRLAGRISIKLADLMGEKLMLPRACTLENSAFMMFCRSTGISFDFMAAEGEHMVDFAALGQYVPVLAERPARFFAGTSVVVLQIEPELYQCSRLAYRKNQRRTEAEQRFLEYVQNHIVELNP